MTASTYSISGNFFFDAAGTGVFQAGDAEATGYTVELLNSDGNLVTSTTTDANGNYSFNGLKNGQYQVQFVAPSGDTFSGSNNNNGNNNDGGDGGDGGASGANSTGVVKVNVSDANVTGVNQGVVGNASVTGTIYNDLNANGLLGAGDTGIGGQTVELLHGSTVVATTTTASNGTYTLSGITPGSYTVKAIAPSGTLFSTASSEAVSLTSGNATSFNVGEYTASTVSGTVFTDQNANGVQNAGDSGLSGVTVELLGANNAVLATTTTGSNGSYSFTGVAPGSDTVKVIAPNGEQFSTASSEAVTVTSGSASTFNAGVYANASVSGTVFTDQNANGVQNAGDAGVAGQTVELLNGSTVVATTATAANGTYSFTGIAPGSYTVEALAPNGTLFSTGASDPVTLNSGATATANVGEYNPVSISGTVFQDNNDNGLVDGSDKGLGGVTVELLNASGQPTGITTTTASNGTYTFSNLAPGTYSVKVDQIATPGAVFSPLGSNTPPQPTSGTPTAAANLLVNGNFNGVTGTGYSLSQGFAGWTESTNTAATPFGSGPGDGIELAVTNGTNAVSYQPGGGTNGYAAVVSPDAANPNYAGGSTTDAAFFVDDSAVETLSQTVTLQAGQVYEIGFDLNYTTPGANNPGFYQLTAAINGQVITTAGSLTGATLTPGVWTHFADLYTPTTTGTYTLTFTYSSGVGLASKDVLVDDVYVVPGQQTANLTTTSEVNALGITAPVTLTSGQTVGNESAGINLPSATVSGTVFADTNGDGTQESGEGGMAGRTVEVIQNGTIIASTQTAADGSYSIGNLAAGSYTVTVLAPSGDTFSTAGNGSQTITVANGATATVNAGIYAPSTVSGTVFTDQNADGVKNGSDAGLSGVTVELLGANNAVLATTTTGSNGSYSFTGVAPGSDTVKVIAPNGEQFSTASSEAVTVTSGSSASFNAGVYATARVSGTVFTDQNANGVQNAGDAGIAGQTVELLSGATVVATATTAADGSYTISGVTPGSYTVEAVAPSGTLFSTPATEAVTLGSGGTASVNVGEYTASTIGGTVFTDQNANGVQNAGDSGLSGVTVELLNGSTVLASTTTAANGSYSFSGVVPGNDTVKVIAPNGEQFSTAATDAVTVTTGSSTNFNVGLYANASVSGTVFTDNNADGTQNGSDAGIGGQTVELLNGSTVVATTTTAANGSYSIGGVTPGSYTIDVLTPRDALLSTPSSEAVTLGSGGSASLNVGEYRTSTVSGQVFLDTNADGVKDQGEGGLGGVTVNLLTATGQPIAGQTTVTAADGSYSFTGVLPGSYEVQAIAPAGDIISPIGTAASPAIDNLANSSGVIGNVAVGSGQTVSGNTIGVAQTGAISSFVFFDAQNDGIYHAGDAVMAGVTVRLLNSLGTVVATTTTNAQGQYGFSGLAAGDYKVQVAAPQGTAFSTTENASNNAALDSDVNAQGLSDTITVSADTTTIGANAGLIFTGNFAGQTPVSLADGQQYASFTGGQVIVGAGDNNVHTGSPGNSVVVLGGSGNTMELGLSTSSQQDVGISAGATQGQTQNAANGFLFAGGSQTSELDGGAGNAYMMGGTGANEIYSGTGNNTIIAGGNNSLITTGGQSTSVIYQAGDGLLTIDNGMRSVDHLTVYGYSSGIIEDVNGIDELVLSPTDKIEFVGATPFTPGVTSGNAEISFVSSITDAPTASVSFNAQGVPVFTAAATLTGSDLSTPAPGTAATPTPPPATVTEPAQSQIVVLGSGTTALNLFGYANSVTGGDTGVTISGDQGDSHFTLGNGNNTLLLGGYNDSVELGNGFNTVSGSQGNLTLTTTGAGNVTVSGYGNAITLGNGDSTISGTSGNAIIGVGQSGSQGGTIDAGGYNNSITTGGGTWTVTAGMGSSSVITGASEDTVLLSGYSNDVTVSTGHDAVSGGAGADTYTVTNFSAAGAATASLNISGFNLAQGDVLDVSGVLSQAGYSGNNLSNYLDVVQSGSDTLVSVTAGGVSHLVADLRGVTANALSVGHGLTI